jgi:ribonuclease HI
VLGLAKKVYAVRKGKKIGIFQTWEECKEAIDGFSKPQYKSFSSLEEAESYLKNENTENINIEKIKDEAVRLNAVIAYVDGSYNKDIQKYSYGCVLITPQKEIIKEYGCGDDSDAILINNVAGELKGSMYATRWSINSGYNKINIRHDYEGIAKWVTGEWKAKNKTVKIYVSQMNGYMKRIDITFTKVSAHTNDYFNDEADRLAKKALSNDC